MLHEKRPLWKQYNMAKLQVLAAIDYLSSEDSIFSGRYANRGRVGILTQLGSHVAGQYITRTYSYVTPKVARPAWKNDGADLKYTLSPQGERVLPQLLDLYFAGKDLHIRRISHEDMDYSEFPLLPGLEDAHRELLQLLYATWWISDGPGNYPDLIANHVRVGTLLDYPKRHRIHLPYRYSDHLSFFKDRSETDRCRIKFKLSPRGHEMLDLLLSRFQAGKTLNPLKKPAQADYTGFKLLPGLPAIEREQNGIYGEKYPGVTEKLKT